MRRWLWIFLMLSLAGVAQAAGFFDLQQRKASHWCWAPIQRQIPPSVKEAAWAKSPIDQFILAKLEQHGLSPAGQADRRVLIRRAYFDVIGLPPSPADTDAFVNDPSPQAFDKVVDRLLASNHFGERWARHWMDVVRYGETRGHEFDPLIPNAWQYRDYLIRAFNADVPFDQFVTEHMAGDLIANPRLNATTGFNESVLGTGFWFLGEEVHSPVDIRQDEADRLNNRVDTMSKAFLGLTVGCARCHDHKFDAISQKDFYALCGFTLSAGYRQVPFMSMQANRKVATQLDALRSAARPKLAAESLDARKPGIAHIADYLNAARQILLAGGDASAKAQEIAGPRSLDPAILRQWAIELAAAQKDPSHVLHAFAEISREPSSQKPEGFAARRQQVLNAMQSSAAAVRDAKVDQIILDYQAESSLAGEFRADGDAFGLRPVRAGEILTGNTVEQPIEGVALRAMASRDPAFSELKPAPGNETDVGTLGQWHRSGQTIRTPKVTLKTGRLWYLVRGAGRAYAVVDSHLIISGPLHGDLLREWNAEKPDAWRWISHDLSAYPGERCHVEFSPVGTGEMQVARVIEANQPPAIDAPNGAVASALSDASDVSLDTMALAYQKLFEIAAERLAANTIAGSADAHDQAALANFLIRKPGLFGVADTASRTPSQNASQFIAGQTSLAAQVVRESPTAPAMWEGNGVDENLLIRGVAKNPGPTVQRRLLEAIVGADSKPYPSTGSGRLQLAQAMLADSDPFVARVMVNRVWQHLFGRGIVPTVDNFGVLGQPPTHPELLDYLADHFRTDQAWSIKKLIRSIMLSSAYQMSSKASPEAEQADPQNLLLHHMPVRRLEAEALRDAILSVSGRLDGRIGGPPIEVHVTEFMDGRGKPSNGPLDGDGRRSIYTRVRRNFLPPMMLAFDTPNPFACVGRRNVSNVPAQALILMNDPLVVDQAKLWATRVLAEPGKSPTDRIIGMYEAALSRKPRAEEVGEMLAFIDEQGKAYGVPSEKRAADPRVWTDLCHVMFNMKEFVFVE